ncbi:MAG: GDP-mannose pyrophosphatase, partial [Hyphomicrobiales bacterium]|nr:GDP-mannose pyrophosphatase [Hyphomicrobiales bacterium]
VDPCSHESPGMIRVLSEEIIDATHWIYKRVVYEIGINGERRRLSREILDRGNAIAILPYDATRGTVILTRQFRLPAFLNGGEDALLEACAGGIEDGDAEAAARRETLEETGFVLREVRRVFEAYMSPGSVTEKIVFFVAPYELAYRQDAGGGLAHEGEAIEVVETSFADALAKMAAGEIRDAKTIMLLQYVQIHGLLA